MLPDWSVQFARSVRDMRVASGAGYTAILLRGMARPLRSHSGTTSPSALLLRTISQSACREGWRVLLLASASVRGGARAWRTGGSHKGSVADRRCAREAEAEKCEQDGRTGLMSRARSALRVPTGGMSRSAEEKRRTTLQSGNLRLRVMSYDGLARGGAVVARTVP